MARWTGLSRVCRESLEALADYLNVGIKTHGTVYSDGKRTKEDFTEEEWRIFKLYCRDDVDYCHSLYENMIPYLPPDALEFISITTKMATEPKFLLNKTALEDYIVELERRAEAARLELFKIFPFATKEDFYKAIRSSAKFSIMMEQLGVSVPMKLSVTKTESMKRRLESQRDALIAVNQSTTEIDARLRNPENYQVWTPALSKMDIEFTELLEYPDPRVQQLVSMRLEHNSSIQMSRAKTFLSLSSTGRPLPVMLKTYFAHTSRYGAGNSEGASESTNLQNLSKRNPNTLQIRKAIYVPEGYKVIACDSSQIEARMLAYAAQEEELLDHYRNGRDVYSEMAEKVYGVPAQEIHDGAKAGDKRLKQYRNVGKCLELQLGYQSGAHKLSDTLYRQGVRLSEDKTEHFELAKHAHNVYRLSHLRIGYFWKVCEKAINVMASGQQMSFGGPTGDLFTAGEMPLLWGGVYGTLPSVVLPSKFILRYPNLRWNEDEFVYDRVRGKNIISTRIYSGSLCENLIQAISFQLLQWQACRMAEDGITLAANIHDSFATIVPDSMVEHTKERMEYWMSKTPDWLSGFPVACEAEIGEDFIIV